MQCSKPVHQRPWDPADAHKYGRENLFKFLGANLKRSGTSTTRLRRCFAHMAGEPRAERDSAKASCTSLNSRAIYIAR